MYITLRCPVRRHGGRQAQGHVRAAARRQAQRPVLFTFDHFDLTRPALWPVPLCPFDFWPDGCDQSFFLFFMTLKPSVEWYTKSMSLKYEPASKLLHISAKSLFLKWKLSLASPVQATRATPGPKPYTLQGYLAHKKGWLNHVLALVAPHVCAHQNP